jgi:hypothetical protein
MHFKIRLEDQHGRFWLTERERRWSDSADDALQFASVDAANQAAADARHRTHPTYHADWFPRIKVVQFA